MNDVSNAAEKPSACWAMPRWVVLLVSGSGRTDALLPGDLVSCRKL